MSAIKSDLVLVLILFHVTNCERRIQNGQNLPVDKSYVVYLVKAPMATSKYDYWTCGGALVTAEFAVTSAACIVDVDYLYVIAGYDKYITDDKIDSDPCTSQKKKKVIYTCFPDGYDIRYERLEKWSLIDIGVVRVESPYDLEDASFRTVCSYIPTTIPINFETKYQEPNTDAIVLGWGHLYKWRVSKDNKNYNQELLKYAPVLIMDKEKCKTHYKIYHNMSAVIDKYMICTLKDGNINANGEPIEDVTAALEICNRTVTSDPDTDSDTDPLRCQEEQDNTYLDSLTDNSRRDAKNSNQIHSASVIDITNRTVISEERTAFNKAAVSKEETVVPNETVENSRRNGICQNDHGGPLVTWVGTHETLIGVASVFKVSNDSECIGPYLYTSTQCNGAFLNCVLTNKRWPYEKKSSKSRRALCRKDANDVGHPMVERYITWLYHPDGPADNEKHRGVGRNDANERLPAETRIVNEGYTTNGYIYAANDRYIADGKYAPDVRYAANERYVPNDKYAVNENLENIGNFGNDRVVMRPQRPLRS